MSESERIEELRQRFNREPGSRLFAQLAEELRKAGQFKEAIEICRAGLLRHPRYWSARITLARAQLEDGAIKEAAQEFKAVLEGVPDNIQARRSLGECLEKMGDLKGAIAQYKEALLYSPGDEWCRKKAEALTLIREAQRDPAQEKRGLEAPSGVVGIKSGNAASVTSSEPPQIRLVEASEEFELDKSHVKSEEVEGERESGMLASPTLAELYFAQGHVDRAIEVYRQIVGRSEEDGKRYNERYRDLKRMSEGRITVMADDRKKKIYRSILRLEAMLEAARRSR
jgi:tetratricopeptide (TPR) repeat protein